MKLLADKPLTDQQQWLAWHESKYDEEIKALLNKLLSAEDRAKCEKEYEARLRELGWDDG